MNFAQILEMKLYYIYGRTINSGHYNLSEIVLYNPPTFRRQKQLREGFSIVKTYNLAHILPHDTARSYLHTPNTNLNTVKWSKHATQTVVMTARPIIL